MRVVLLTREDPSAVYGGAGAHVAQLAKELRKLAHVRVRYGVHPAVPPADADVVHSHTRHAHAAGYLAKTLHGTPHVMTLYSRESWPARPALHSADRIITVSRALRDDLLTAHPELSAQRVRVVHPGVDTITHQPDHRMEALQRYGIDPLRPIVLFVGRTTRRDGLRHLLQAAFDIRPEAQLVLCCAQPDTPGPAAEAAWLVEELGTRRAGVFCIDIDGTLDPVSLRQLLTHATVYVCPSRHDPLGSLSLEAMACGTAVVAADTGGIREVVADGKTGDPGPDRAGPSPLRLRPRRSRQHAARGP